MCGILGTTQAVDSDRFLCALDTISHRGPDDRGVFQNERVCLGHHRLAIQDLTDLGHQPMSALNGQVWIVFNGEIYNHPELKQSLSKEFTYRGSSDTETILYGYLKYGKDVVCHLNGIFAFAIYDSRSNELFVARDQLGVKPLYYYAANNTVAFASEIKALAKLPNVDLTVEPSAFQDYLHFLWSPGESTPFRHIKKLKPGHYFCKKLGDPAPLEFTKYYEIPFSGEYSSQSESDLLDDLDDHLNRAVRRQLLSDVPVGFFLSGGLDSSLIAAIAKKQQGSGFRCYTVNMEDEKSLDGFSDDLRYARTVAKHIDANLIEIHSKFDIVKDFDKMIWHLDEPQADPAPLHVLNICESARQHGDVVLLGGTAGDDLFSGYRRHQAVSLDKWFQACPKSIGRAMEGFTGLLGTNSPLFRRLGKLTKGLKFGPVERMANYYGWIDIERNRSLFRSEILDSFRERDPSKLLMDALGEIPNEKERLNQMLYWDMKFFLADHNLNYTDKMSMAHGVEVRVPFLDLELVEFACKLPVRLKMKGREAKYLLKKVAERYLPKEVIYRPKTGFGAPVRSWIVNGDLQPLVDRILNQENVAFTSIFSTESIIKLMNDTKSGRYDGAYTIWSLLAIDSWLTQFASPVN